MDNKIKYGLKKKGRNSLYGQEWTSVLFGPNHNENKKGDDVPVENRRLCCREDGAKFNFKHTDLCGDCFCQMMTEFEVYSVKNYIQ